MPDNIIQAAAADDMNQESILAIIEQDDSINELLALYDQIK